MSGTHGDIAIADGGRRRNDMEVHIDIDGCRDRQVSRGGEFFLLCCELLRDADVIRARLRGATSERFRGGCCPDSDRKGGGYKKRLDVHDGKSGVLCLRSIIQLLLDLCSLIWNPSHAANILPLYILILEYRDDKHLDLFEGIGKVVFCAAAHWNL